MRREFFFTYIATFSLFIENMLKLIAWMWRRRFWTDRWFWGLLGAKLCSLTFSRILSPSHSVSLSLTHSLILFLTLTIILSLFTLLHPLFDISHSFSYSFSLTHSLCHSFCLSHENTHKYKNFYNFFLTSFSVALSLSLSLFLSLPLLRDLPHAHASFIFVSPTRTLNTQILTPTASKVHSSSSIFYFIFYSTWQSWWCMR